MPYAHAAPGEQCAKCDRPAARIIGTQPHCVDHFAALLDHLTHVVRRRTLTPTDVSPDGLTAWAEHLRQAIIFGIITDDEAAKAWNTARDFAA